MINNYEDWKLNEGLDPHVRSAHIRKHLTDDQIDWCNYHIKFGWLVNDEGEVYTKYDIDFNKKGEITEIPVQFADRASFNISNLVNLTSLKGCPKIVGKAMPGQVASNVFTLLDISGCKSLTSLQYASLPYQENHYLKGGTWIVARPTPQKSDPLPNLNPREKELFFDAIDRGPHTIEKTGAVDILITWLKSGTDVEEFFQKKRGYIAGKNYGL
jgi:hypothetical protein